MGLVDGEASVVVISPSPGHTRPAGGVARLHVLLGITVLALSAPDVGLRGSNPVEHVAWSDAPADTPFAGNPRCAGRFSPLGPLSEGPAARAPDPALIACSQVSRVPQDGRAGLPVTVIVDTYVARGSWGSS